MRLTREDLIFLIHALPPSLSGDLEENLIFHLAESPAQLDARLNALIKRIAEALNKPAKEGA